MRCCQISTAGTKAEPEESYRQVKKAEKNKVKRSLGFVPGLSYSSYSFRKLKTDMAKTLTTLVKGAIAGGLGVWLMDRFTWYWYSHEDTGTLVKERTAQKGGRYAPNAVGKHLTDTLKIALSQKKQYVTGRSIHYFMGIAPAALYALWRHHMKCLRYLRGPVYGFALFIAFDEIITPALGYASGPFSYPWQAHARGFFAHLILGTATDIALNLLTKTN